ncbi:CBASS cGAMP synthase [Halpernia sp.]|uniref:CBASS cGAMP synthase n=1 Tax=Halpernia sp. TaxID=2782209 RepID=UPI003A91BED8
MADLHATFTEFDDIIRLSSKKKDKLRTSRDSIRTDIEKYFEEYRDKHTVGFKGQGSFMMHTTIHPLSSEYDVDDGVYIFGKEEDRPTMQTAHNWIFDAVRNRTSSESSDKNTCIRVVYKSDYHVDLPIYYKTDNSEDEYTLDDEIPQLAHLTKGWIKSDPYAFTKWFLEKAKGKPQLKRIVRYLKAWSDKRQNDNSSFRFPSGMVFTILASNSYVEDNRDDVSLLETLKAIQKEIDDTRFNYSYYECYRPTVDETENLLDKYSAKTTKDNFLNALDSLIESGAQAIELKSKKDACSKWQKHLGDRFPCSSVVEETSNAAAKVFSSPDQLSFDNKSA